MLLGFREELLVLAQEQVFDITMAYKAVAASVEKTVECTFSAKRFRELRLPQSIKNDTKKVGGYFHFHLNGIVHYSPEGLVFGVLPLPKQ